MMNNFWSFKKNYYFYVITKQTKHLPHGGIKPTKKKEKTL